MSGRVLHLLLSVIAFVAGIAVVMCAPPEACLPAAALLTLAWVIARERGRLDQLGLYRLYTVSIAIVILTIAGLVVADASTRPPDWAMIAGAAIFFALVIACARRDLDRSGRRKFYVASIVVAALIIVGSLVFVPAIGFGGR